MPNLRSPSLQARLAVGLTFAAALSPAPFPLRGEGPLRPCFLPEALLTNITKVGTPTPGSCRTVGREASRPKPWSQPPTAGKTAPAASPSRSPGGVLTSCLQQTGTMGVYMCLGKGIKGTNVQGQSQKRLWSHTCCPFPPGPTHSRRNPSFSILD